MAEIPSTKSADLIGWLDTTVGGVMLSSVFWSHALQGLSLLLHLVVLGCGAIIGIHGVRRIWRNREPTETSNEEIE